LTITPGADPLRNGDASIDGLATTAADLDASYWTTMFEKSRQIFFPDNWIYLLG
jgi:hypothetical protein